MDKGYIECTKISSQQNTPVIYRDLKPANLIVDDSDQLRLVDFGTARYYSDEISEDTVYIGTQGYAAPEQYGIGQTDQRTDLYSLGMTIIHLATGIHPVKLGSDSIRDSLRKAGITQNFIRFVLKLTQTDPLKRFQTCEKAIEELDRIMNPERQFLKNYIAKKPRKTSGSNSNCFGAAGKRVTSLCLAIGKHLSDNKVNSVLVELNSSGDFNRMRQYLDELGEVKYQSDNRFETNNLIFYPNASDFGEVSRKGIDAVILDVGQLNAERKISQFNHADIRIVVCPCMPWKYDLFSECNKNIESSTKNEWIYAASVTQSYEGQKLKKLLGSNKLVLYSAVKNPFYLSIEEHKRIGTALNKICALAGK